MQETEYLRQDNVLVTSTRIEIDGQTFAVRNVGSVKVTRPGLPWIAMLIVIGCGIYGSARESAGVWVVAAGAAAWAFQQLRQRRLVLVTGGGEVLALKSNNGEQVEALRAAVAQAIAVR